MMLSIHRHNRETKPGDWAISGLDLMNMPAADVVEVVRCKDCLHRCRNGTCEIAPAPTSVFVSDTDFCSHGERMADNGRN